ncbi:MAG: tetratricopeptide repeat protein, partial [Phycisphaerae bacterium]|nr:tetratricopeptide repeat protein [Phycisphaerae bacterium]
YNRGIFLQNLERPEQAADAYETAIRLDPDHVLARVNVSLVYAGLSHRAAEVGKAERVVREYAAKAERVLREALRIAPANAAANFNFGLLLSELGRLPEAEACLRQALKTDPNFPEAAYNLGVLLAHDRLDEAIVFCGKAAELRPGDPKYAYTLAFFLHRKGELEAARTALERLIDQHPEYADAYRLLDAVEQDIIRRDVKD